MRKTSLLQDRSDGVRSSSRLETLAARTRRRDHQATNEKSRVERSEIAHRPPITARAMLGAISSSRCQTARARSMPFRTQDPFRYESLPDSNGRGIHFANEHPRSAITPLGGARRDRTDDLLLAKQ